MYTIKFLTTDSEHLLEDDVPARVTHLHEGTHIWHRSYHVTSEKEFKEWEKEYFSFPNIQHHVFGIDPVYLLSKMDGSKPLVQFEFLQFEDSDHQWHYCIICHAECFIMNKEGQTIDKVYN